MSRLFCVYHHCENGNGDNARMATRTLSTNSPEPIICEPTKAEFAWIEDQLSMAARLMADDPQPGTLAALDRAFAAWAFEEPCDVTFVNHVINAVGIAFGKRLVDGLHLRWVVATDEYGSDLAVYRLKGTANALLYPANFVAKRWERRETFFLEASFLAVAKSVESILGS